jgi:DNA-directed RNA polymerase specialized sigma24 family protein
MPSEGSVTTWIGRLQAGDHAAAQPLWERYFLRLVGLARKKLGDAPRRAADEEDVALSAFDSFCRGAGGGRYPQLSDRDDLWRLLVMLTAHKALDLVRHEHSQKRGGGAVLDEGAFAAPADSAGAARGLEQIVGAEPTPEFAAQVAEEYRLRLEQLGDDELRTIAVAKMEGHSNEAIAARLGCAVSTVERRLALIRRTWEEEGLP